MAQIYDLPPILKGTEKEQINQLRDYLMKLIMILNQEGEKKK